MPVFLWMSFERELTLDAADGDEASWMHVVLQYYKHDIKMTLLLQNVFF